MNIAFRLCIEADLDIADTILVAAYQFQGSRRTMLERHYLAVQPDGWWLALVNGTPVGFGGAVDYGTCCSIGMLSVLPSWQGKGIGTALMHQILRWCEARECPTMILEAEEHAVSLYTRLGFVIEESTLFLAQTAHPTLDAVPDVTLLPESDFPLLAQFDTAVFGGTRTAMLLAHWQSNRERTFVTRNAAGQITSYLIAQSSSLGPWIGGTLHDAEALLNRALMAPFLRHPTVTIPSSNQQGIALLQRYGFAPGKKNLYMRRGNPFAGIRTAIYGQASPALG